MPRPFAWLLPLVLAAPVAADEPVRFAADVAPILVKKCLGCHDDRKAESGLNMTTFARLKQGGKTLGTDILVAGDPDASYLIELIRPDANPRMPYKQDPLSEAEVRTLERWVAEGAKFDGASETETRLATLVDPLANLPTIALKVPAAEPITAAAFAPDGATVAAARGRDVLLFDNGSGKPVATLADHPGPLTAVAFTPDGKTLIAAGGRPGMWGSIIVWELTTHLRRLDLRGHADAILGIAVSPDGSTLATASYDRLVKLWDLADGRELRTLKEHTEAVHAVAFSPDGQALASAGADRTVKVWDVATGRKRVTLPDATAELYAVTFAPDGRNVLAGGVDRSIRAWEIDGDNATLARSAFAHEGAVLRLAITPDGKTLVSAGEDRAVKVWDLATLEPRASFGNQADWPLALAIRTDGTTLAVGRYDGSLDLLALEDGKRRLALLEAPGAAKPAKPELTRKPTLDPPNPRGAVRGTTRLVTLTGNGVGLADAVVFDAPGLSAAVVPPEKPDRNRLDLDVTIANDAPIGVHRLGVRTPLGTPAFRPFAVSAAAEVGEAEPNEDPVRTPTVALPATLLGTIGAAGDVDHFRFEAKAGQSLVFESLARPIGSAWVGALALLDDAGRVLAESSRPADGLDPRLIFVAPRDGTHTLRIADADFAGSGNHLYRIQAGPLPYLASAFPLGVERGKPARVVLDGVNLVSSDVELSAEATGREPGAILTIGTPESGIEAINTRKVVVAEGPQSGESSANDEPGTAEAIAAPGGVSGRIETPGDVDHYRFEAKKGQRRIVEVFGRRLGSPIDPRIEILDAQGRPLPRAVLRPVAETEVAFRDHPSTGRNIRLTKWNDFAVGDYVLVGRELMRLFELPRNPDDDAVFWGLGDPRNNTGERTAFLETTPEHHPQGQAIYKVELHPPGATFPAGGLPAVTLDYRNDDGGPGLGKDARLTFDPPADCSYAVRIDDARGFGGAEYGYHLVVREPRPGFALTVADANPTIYRGTSAVINVGVERIDGYDGPVEITAEGLPPGVSATIATVEPGQYAADMILSADDSAPASSPPTWRLVGRAVVDGAEVRRTLDPGGPSAGWVSVVPGPNLTVEVRADRVEIRPGERIELTLAVERRNGFAGRVPIDVRNLPLGVRVLNIGLNGVLVTESQTERSVFLYAEPWAEPTERPFVAVGRCEAAGTEHGSRPLPLVVRPAGGAGRP